MRKMLKELMPWQKKKNKIGELLKKLVYLPENHIKQIEQSKSWAEREALMKKSKLSQAERQKIADIWAAVYKAHYARDFKDMIEAVKFFTYRRSPKKKTVLDVGTGTGVIPAVASVIKPATYIGIDFSKKALQEAVKNVKKVGGSVQFIQADASNKKAFFPIKDKSINQVWLSRTRAWFPFEKKTFSEIKRVLKPGGIVKQVEIEPEEVKFIERQGRMVPANKEKYEKKYAKYGFKAKVKTKVIPSPSPFWWTRVTIIARPKAKARKWLKK